MISDEDCNVGWEGVVGEGADLGHLPQSLLSLVTQFPQIPSINHRSDRHRRDDREHHAGHFGGDHDHRGDYVPKPKPHIRAISSQRRRGRARSSLPPTTAEITALKRPQFISLLYITLQKTPQNPPQPITQITRHTLPYNSRIRPQPRNNISRLRVREFRLLLESRVVCLFPIAQTSAPVQKSPS